MKPAALALLPVLLIAACTQRVETGPRTVTLVTHDSFDVSKDVLSEFEAQSGIDVEVLPAGDAGQVVNRAILTAGNPEGDVLFGIDDNLLYDAFEAGVFEPYASPRLAAVPDGYELDPEHRVTPIDHGDVCVNYDVEWFASRDIDPPATLEDLAEPMYRGLLVVENPATSTPGLAFLLATIARFGDGWEGYWTTLVENEVTIVNGWERAYFGEFSGAGGGSGTLPLVVSYASSPPAEIVFAEEPLDEAPTAVIEDTCYRQIEFAGILAGAEHPDEARALIDFMLSREFQEDIPLRMFVFPVVTDAELPDVFVENAIVPKDPLSLPAAEVSARRAEWVQRWTDVVLR
jgi:thiamine transport system substrate-binding protein